MSKKCGMPSLHHCTCGLLDMHHGIHALSSELNTMILSNGATTVLFMKDTMYVLSNQNAMVLICIKQKVLCKYHEEVP